MRGRKSSERECEVGGSCHAKIKLNSFSLHSMAIKGKKRERE